MLAPNTRLRDRYRILHRVGGGGFGDVYKAVDDVFGCTVAIKETKEQVSSHEQLRKAFEREAKLLRNLKHECLPRVTDYFFLDHAQYLVMDYIEGEDLYARLKKRIGREGPFTVAEILPWADKVLSALDYLHTRPEPIIHRDIKPSNITLTEAGEIYLLDFGLAKGLTGQMSTMLEGQSLMSLAAFTHEYAPLEQLQSTGTEPQSDIYAFGATLYHLLTGHTPISASKRDEAIHREKRDPLRPAHEVNPAIPLEVSEIISQAMIIRWWDRISSAGEMRAALRRVSSQIDNDPNQAETQHDSPFASANQDQVATRPLQPPDLHRSKESAQTIPTHAVLKPAHPYRSWLIAGLSVTILAAAAVGVRLTFPHWFKSARSTQSTTPPTTLRNSASLMTPTDLSPRLLLEHKGAVWSVAFSQDGSLAASGSNDGTVILWDTKTWKPSSDPLTAHASPVYSVAFSPNGKTLATASKNGTIILWDVQTKEPKKLQDGTARSKWASLVAFSPDDSAGAVLVSVGGQGGNQEIRLWYEQTGWQSKTLPFNASEGKIFALVFSPDGNTLATAGEPKTIRLWNLKNERGVRELDVSGPTKIFVGRLAFSPDGKYLAAGISDGVIKLWRTENWQETTPLEREHKGVITGLAFSPDNTSLVSASKDQTLRLWNITNRTSKGLASGEEVPQLAFSPDGQTLLCGGTMTYAITVWQRPQIQR